MTDAATKDIELHGYVSMLVGVRPTVSGTERILAGTERDGLLHLVVETDRSSNAPLLASRVLYLHEGDRTRRWRRVGTRALRPGEREALDRTTPAPIGESLAIMVLRPAPIPPIGCIEP